MKKIAVILFAFFAISATSQTKAYVIAKDDVFNKASASAAMYAQQIIDTKVFDTYFEVNRKNSKMIYNQNLRHFNGKSAAENELLGYVINIRMKPEFQPNSNAVMDLNLFVDPNYTVYFDENWNSGSTAPISENIAVIYQILPKDHIFMFIGALNVYAVALSKNEVLTKEQVLAFADNSDRGKKWETPVIKQNSIPDYGVYWEITEADCTECEKLEIKINQETILNTTTVVKEKM
ncbi:MAG TPA: hypothetical protein VK623_01290 [Flavobacterium sp.]|nr:hypothetical protein [Flavobacterium sp.]